MTRDRGQKTGDGVGPTTTAILIIAVVSYIALDLAGISLWDVLLAGGAVVGLVLALLVARGMYLIGQGSDAEFEAREKAADSKIFGSGFFLLDWLRTADLGLLGEGTKTRTYRCPSCRHTWKHDERRGWAVCPECGSEKTDPVG